MHRFVLLGVIWLGLSASPAQAATIPVNFTSDVLADDGHCSLREAVIAANTDSASGAKASECPGGDGPDQIVLPHGTYALSIAPSRQ